MVKTSATSQSELASTAKPVASHPSKTAKSDEHTIVRANFTGAAIGMSWQLAIIVLVPILGGYKLDQSTGSTPLWTLVGLTVALSGSIFVVRKALATINNFNVSPATGAIDKHDEVRDV